MIFQTSSLSSLLLLAAAFLLRVWLLSRQRGVLRADPAAVYARAIVTQRGIQQVWQLTWALLVLVGASSIEALERQVGAIATLIVLLMAGWLWDLPAKAWKVFVIDAGHAFNRLAPLRFVREQSLSALLFAGLAVPGAASAVLLLEGYGDGWWLPTWALGWLGYVALRWLRPRYIASLFDVVEPLPDGPLRERLHALLKRCGVSGHRLFLMRTSTRSAQANAQVSGGLGAPRIVLMDTLVDRLQPEEIEAVVAHELGHLQRGHLRVQMLMLGALWFVLVALIALLIRDVPPVAAKLALAWALMPSAWLFAQPFANAVYRRFEFEADESAAQNSKAAAMAAALRTLTRNNANATGTDRWYEWVYHTHPALSARLARLDRVVS